VYGPLVTAPLIRVSPPGLLVGDTGALMNELVQATRNGRPTSLLIGMCQDTVRLFISRDVLTEVERNLPGYAADRGLDPRAVLLTWFKSYKPLIAVVDVPGSWAADNPVVQAVVDRHATDAPTARLATALAPCHVLAEDGDLTDFGLGDKDWLPLAHAFANQAELEWISSVVALPTVIVAALGADLGQKAVRLPVAGRCLLVAGLLGIAYIWQKDGRTRRHLQKAGVTIKRVAKVAGPPLLELADRYVLGAAVQADRAVPSTDVRGLPEQIARELALAPPRGLRAADIARTVQYPGNLKVRTAAVHAALDGCDAFAQVSRGRWRVGDAPTADASTLAPDDYVIWLARAHRTTLPQLSTDLAAVRSAPSTMVL
jgi:hypothetical protein